MEENVGKEYILPGETRKRDRSDVIWITVWLVLLICWSSFLITMSIISNFWSMPIKDILALLFICNIPTLVFSVGFGIMLKTSKGVRATEFLIHEYERWNCELNDYVKLYLTETVYLYGNYTYHKHTGDSIIKMTTQELTEYCAMLPRDYSTFIGYKTKEEAMKNILDDIKRLIAIDKINENIKIKNVNTLETFSVDELKTKIKNKEFDHLYQEKAK